MGLLTASTCDESLLKGLGKLSMGTNKCMKCFESVKAVKQSKQKGNWDFRWSKNFDRVESFYYNRSRLLFAKIEDRFKVLKPLIIFFVLHVGRWFVRK